MNQEPASASRPLASTALIVGCGYVGVRLGRQLVERGVSTFGTTRSPDRGRTLSEAGIRPLLVHITQPVTLASLRPALEADELDVYYLIPPGRPSQHPTPRQVVLGGIAHTIRALKQAQVRRAVLVSSTAVYGQHNGRPVDADTPARPVGDRARLLREGEQLWLDAGPAYHVVRLAGLYGPGRIVGFKQVVDGAPLLGDPRSLLNLIHVDDAVALLLAVMQAAEPGRVELGSDGQPVERETYYGYLADRLGVPQPELMDDEEAARRFGLNVERLRQRTSKALDPGPTMRRTGWQPRYTDFRQGLDPMLG